jgi:hypothetical protein
MFFRNFLRVILGMLALLVVLAAFYIGPILNVAGVLPIGWALAILFFNIALAATALITYRDKCFEWLKFEKK